MSLDLRNRDANSVVALLSRHSDRIVLVVALAPGAIASGIKAGALVKLGSAILGGGGGGKDDFAQGGGTDTSKIALAITELKAAIGSN
jgi:alanyl-tRNA synthetase